MINTKYVRDNIDAIKASLKHRHSDFDINKLLELDEEWRKLKATTQELQAERNKASMEVSELKKNKKEKEAEKIIAKLADVKDKITKNEEKLGKYEETINKMLWNMPNILDKSVPEGIPPDGSKTLKKWGKIKKQTGPSHEEVLNKLGMLDIERAAKVAGARFYYLKGDLVLLEQSLSRYALDKLSKKGFTPVLPPFMMKKKYYSGVAPLGVFEDALYRISESKEAESMKDVEHVEDELFMISTAEHPLTAMFADEILSAKELPMKFAGISPAFRREAGAHGKDTKGIFRVHQFDKVEQVIFCKQEDEEKCFNELLANSEEFMQDLELPYRLLLLCTGDTGLQMAKTVDIECWFPSQKDYRELGSCSTASTWQSMRLDTKYEDKGERKYVYTLNNTGITVARTLACIVENYVNEDGTITIPEVLVPYMGKKKIG